MTIYNERAQKWYERSLEEDDEFVKFVLMYIALEVITKSKSLSIHEISQVQLIRTKFYRNIALKYLEELKNKLEKNPLQNLKPRKGDNWSGKLKNIDDFDGIIKFIIRARNNLFHGDKGLDEKRDEFIVKEGNRILEPLLISII